jgi:hypothetical protein
MPSLRPDLDLARPDRPLPFQFDPLFDQYRLSPFFWRRTLIDANIYPNGSSFWTLESRSGSLAWDR